MHNENGVYMTFATANDVTSVIKHFPGNFKKIHESNQIENQNYCLKICGAALPVYARCHGDCNFCLNILIYLIYYL